jgi:hypothetical protein
LLLSVAFLFVGRRFSGPPLRQAGTLRKAVIYLTWTVALFLTLVALALLVKRM